MINRACQEYLRQNRGASKNNSYTEKAVHAALARVGFVAVHTMKGDEGRMPANEFRRWKESLVKEDIYSPFAAETDYADPL